MQINYLFEKVPNGIVYLVDNNSKIISSTLNITPESINRESQNVLATKGVIICEDPLPHFKELWLESLITVSSNGSYGATIEIVNRSHSFDGFSEHFLVSNRGNAMMLRPNVLQKNKNNQYADLEYCCVFFILNVAGVNVLPQTQDKRILESIRTLR